MNLKQLSKFVIISVSLFMSSLALAQNSMYITPDGDVGFGTDTPTEKVHILDGDLRVEQSDPGISSILKFATEGSEWEIKQNGDTGRLTFFSPGGGAITASFKFDRAAVENLFRVGVVAADTVDINGKLVINGSDVTPDYVFEPEYELESIEEHAKFMWDNKHLPAMKSAQENETEGVNVVAHQYGVLEELEKAHIYIAQMNEVVKELQEEVRRLKEAR